MSNQVLRGTGFRVLWEIKLKNQKQEKNQIKKQQKVENGMIYCFRFIFLLIVYFVFMNFIFLDGRFLRGVLCYDGDDGGKF